jgi:hypothetical protein
MGFELVSNIQVDFLAGPVGYFLWYLGLPNRFQHPRDQLQSILLTKHIKQQCV